MKFHLGHFLRCTLGLCTATKHLALQRAYAITSHCLRPYCTAKLRYFIDMCKGIYRFFFLRFLCLFCDKSDFGIKTKLYVYAFVGLK